MQGFYGFALSAQDHEIVGVGHEASAEASLQPELLPSQLVHGWRKQKPGLSINRAKVAHRQASVTTLSPNPTGLYEEGQVKPERLVRAAYCGTPAFILASMA